MRVRCAAAVGPRTPATRRLQMSEEMAGMPAPEGAAKRISPTRCQPLLNIAVGKLEPQAKAFRYSVAAGYENGGHQAIAAADAPDAGDEAVAFKTSATGSIQMRTTVGRSGATVVAFGHYTAELPDEVLSAQISKAEKVAG